MEEIKNIIHNVFSSLSSSKIHHDQELFVLWDTLLDETEKKHVRLSGIKGDALYVDTDSSAWLYQMKLKAKILLAGIQEHFPKIKKIYIKIGSIL